MKTVVWFGFLLGAVSAASKVFYTKPGQSVTLECGVNGYPQSLAWRRGNDLIIGLDRRGFPLKGNSDISSRSRLKQDTNLEISVVTKNDAGTFTCVADRTTNTHTLVVVSVSASPSAELQVGSKTTFQCEVNGLSSGYTVQWTRPDGTKASESMTYELNPVAKSHAGTWMCIISYNRETHSESLNVTVKEPTTTTTVPSSTKPSKDDHKIPCSDCNNPPVRWWVWCAVGVGCLVAVLLMVLVIVMCKRVRRRKKRFQTMKNGRSKQYCQCTRPAAAARPQQGRQREKPSALRVKPLQIA